jgi:hypothetical protein
MMLQPTGIKTLKRYGLTTGRVEKNRSASRRLQKSQKRGERKTPEGMLLTQVSVEPYGMAAWYDSPVADVEKQKQSRITKTTTSLLKLCGFANHATSNDIRK